MEGIDDAMEDEILWRVANRADRNLAIESNGEASSHYEPELAEAMQLTGGYVGWLRENASAYLATIENPNWVKRRCTRLGMFVAYMRARPSVRQDETAEREFAARLVSQLIRLGKCLALVLNKAAVDADVMLRVKRVALDTARGKTLAIASYLYDSGDTGLPPGSIAMRVSLTEDKARTLLRFLRQIGVVEFYSDDTTKNRPYWRLTPRLHRLFAEVMHDHEEEE
jgi:hypothetical protein